MQINSKLCYKDFEVIYKGNRILVKNEGAEGERLIINSILYDQNTVPDNGKLAGFIYDANHNTYKIEVFLGGIETLECSIHVNGEQIYSNLKSHEHNFQQKNIKKHGKGNRLNNFVLFLVILMAFICILSVVPDVLFGQLQEEAIEQDDAADLIDSDGRGGAILPVSNDITYPTKKIIGNEEYIEANYTWNYGTEQWNFSLKIPSSAYDYYKTVKRKGISNYSYYVNDTTDDTYLAELTKSFKIAAKKENYSDYDMVNYIICFVQNLNYVSDVLGTGYDEYPKFPLETLADEGGDCEDSAILLASLLKELGYDTVLIQLPDHMAVGVKGERTMPGSYYEVDGKLYFYVETTSPGWRIGQIPDELNYQTAKILSLL